MRASELLLIVRAQNQASGALRRVASDMKGLSTLGGLRQRGQALQIARNEAMATRENLKNQLKSITTGKQALSMMRERQAAEMGMQSALSRRSMVEQNMLAREAALQRNIAQRSELTRRVKTAPTAAIQNELRSRLKAAQIDAERLGQKQGYLRNKLEAATAAIAKQATALQVLSAKEAEAANRADQLRNRIANYGDRLRLNSEQIKANNRAMNAARWDKVAAGGRILQHSARVAQYAGLVLGGTLAVVANNAAKFDTSVTLAATQTRKAGQSFLGTAKNSKILQRDIMSLMREFPASADDFSRAAYDIYSSTDVSFRGGRRALKLFAQAAVAGQTDVQTATDAGIVVLNNFGNRVDLMPKRLQRMFAAVRFGRMTFRDFAVSMSTIGPAARAANQSFDEMAGTFAFLTRHLDVAKARVGFARVLEALSSPKMLAGLEGVGIKIQDSTHRLLPLHDIIGKIVTKFPQLRRGGTDAMNFFKNIGGNTGTIQARRAFTFLVQFFDRAGKDGASYLDMLHKVKNDNNEFTQSLKAMEKTTGVRWGVFINQLKALALAIGASVVPALLKMSGPIQAIVKWWERLDESTKNQIGRWAAYAAGIMLVGGALSFLLGTVIRMVAFFGRFIGMAGSLAVTLALIATLAAAVTGHIRDLSDVMNNLVSLGTGSMMGWVTMLTLAAGAALKFSGAMRGMAMTGGAAAGGGLLARVFGGARSGRAGLSLAKEAMQTKGIVAGLASSVALIPGGLLAAGAAMAVVAGGALLWKRHMEGVAEHTAHVNAYLNNIKLLSQIPAQRAQQFGGIAGSVEDITRQKIAIREIQRAIVQTKKDLAGTTGTKRSALVDQLTIQQLDLANATQHLHDVTAKSNQQFDAFTGHLQAQGRNVGAIVDMRNRMAELVKQRDALQRGGVLKENDIARVNEKIKITQRTINMMASGILRGGQALRTEFTQAVNQLSRMKILPKVSPGAIEDMFKLALRRGRALTIPEMKAVIRAEVSPASLKKAKADIRSVVMGGQTERGAAIVGAMAGKRAPVKIAGIVIPSNLVPPKNTKAVHAGIAKVFRKVIVQHVRIATPTPNAASVGAAIDQGIAAGIANNAGIVNAAAAAVAQGALDAARAHIKSGSPSRLFAEKIGKPISQGIAVGILEAAGEVERAATIVMDLFQGAILSKLSEKKKPTAALLTKDLQSQVNQFKMFNNALARLSRRGVPKELVDQLAALGPEAADKIRLLARMSAPELRRYVNLWRQAQKEIKRSMRITQADIMTAMKGLKNQAADNLMSTFSSMRDTNVSNFGGIFDGLDSKVGDAFKSAMDEYNNSVSDFQGQIRDLNQQLADTQKEAQQRLIDAIASRKDELQQIMGQLFGGDWLQGDVVRTKLDWGQQLGFDDLQKDLESQVAKFQRWRKDITELAAKVPPELAKQLEQLGPEAVDKLDILNNATDDQLKQYVATWLTGQTAIAAVANQTTVDTSDIVARTNDILKQIDDVTQKLGALQMPKELTGQDIIDNLKKQQEQWVQYQDLIQTLIDKGLPASFIQQLQQMGPQAIPYLKALVGMSDEQLKELALTWDKNQQLIQDATIKMLNTQLALWFQYGKNIALNIIAGIGSENVALVKYFKELFMSLLKGLPIPSPPPLVSSPIGTPAVPVVNPSSTTNWRQFESPAGTTDSRTFLTVEEGAVQVTAVQDESLQTTLDRASFRFLNQVPG